MTRPGAALFVFIVDSFPFATLYFLNSLDAAARNALIEAHLWRVDQLAKLVYCQMPRNIPLDDLRQEGALALFHCAAHFNPAIGDFGSYAALRVRGAMLDAVRKETGVRSESDGEGGRVLMGVHRDHIELREWHAVRPAEYQPDAERREQEIEAAEKQLNALLQKVRLKHRITFWEFRKRGFRPGTATQDGDVVRMMWALRRAAGIRVKPAVIRKYSARAHA